MQCNEVSYLYKWSYARDRHEVNPDNVELLELAGTTLRIVCRIARMNLEQREAYVGSAESAGHRVHTEQPQETPRIRRASLQDMEP